MNSYVMIFVPCGERRDDIESAIRQHVDRPEFIEVPTATRPAVIEDADQLPLWRWFTF